MNKPLNLGVLKQHMSHKFKVVVTDFEDLTLQVVSVNVNEPLQIVFRDDIKNIVRDTLSVRRGNYFDIKVLLLDNDTVSRTYEFMDYRLVGYKESEFDYASELPHTISVILRPRRGTDIDVSPKEKDTSKLS